MIGAKVIQLNPPRTGIIVAVRILIEIKWHNCKVEHFARSELKHAGKHWRVKSEG